MSFCNELELDVLDLIFGGTAYTPAATLYIGLSKTPPNDDGSGFTEPVGNGYARAAVTNNPTNWPAASGAQKHNNGNIDFPTATGSWGTVTHFGIFTEASGVLPPIATGPLTAPKSPQNGDTVRFADQQIVISLD